MGWRIWWHLLFWLFIQLEKHFVLRLVYLFTAGYVNNPSNYFVLSFTLLFSTPSSVFHWFLFRLSSEDSLFQLGLNCKCMEGSWQKHNSGKVLECLSKCLHPPREPLGLLPANCWNCLRPRKYLLFIPVSYVCHVAEGTKTNPVNSWIHGKLPLSPNMQERHLHRLHGSVAQ